MRPWRIWLVVVLALLLPVRGAVAATLMRAPPPAAATVVHATHAAHAACEQAGAADHDRCSVCAACFAATALPSAAPLPGAPARARARFAEPAAPPPAMLADALERPPRAR